MFPLPEIPNSDASSSVPIPTVIKAPTARMEKKTKDEIHQSEADEIALWDSTKLYELPRSRMSLLEFVRTINRNLDLYKQGQEYAELVDEVMNKKFNDSLARSSISLRHYRSVLLHHLVRWCALEDEIQEVVSKLNRVITWYNHEVDTDNEERTHLNHAIRHSIESKAQNSPRLKRALKRYALYRNGPFEGTGRNALIILLNSQIEDYNARLVEFNSIIHELNIERKAFQTFPIKLLVPMSAVLELPEVPTPPHGEIDVDEFVEIPLVEERLQPIPEKFFGKLYDPVHLATIGYMNNLSHLFSIEQAFDEFDSFKGRVISSNYLDIDASQYVRVYLESIGKAANQESSLRTGISWNTLDRLLARSQMRASMTEAGIPLTIKELDELQIMILSLLSKIGLQSSTGPAFHVLGDDLQKVGIDDRHIAISLALAFLNRLCSVVESNVIAENISSWVQKHSKLAAYPQSKRSILIDRLTSVVSLALLQNGLAQASIALGTPDLARQVLKAALDRAGVGKEIKAPNFNEVLNDSSSMVVIQSHLTSDLVKHGFDAETARSIVSRAVGNTVDRTPFSTLDDFVDHLSAEIKLSGIDDAATARSLALRGSNYLLGMSPRSSLEEHLFDRCMIMGLIDSDVLLTDEAIESALKGLDRKALESKYRKGVSDLYRHVDPKDFIDHYATHPYLRNQDDDPPPMTTRQAMLTLYRNLLSQGVDANDALLVAEQLLLYLYNNSGVQKAFAVAPQALIVLQRSFQRMFELMELRSSAAKDLSVNVVTELLKQPELLEDEDLVVRIGRSIVAVVKAKAQGIERALHFTLRADGKVPNIGAVSHDVSQAIMADKGCLDQKAFLAASARRALRGQEGLNLSLSHATYLAGVFAERVSREGLSADDTSRLKRALENEKIEPSVTESLTAWIEPHLGNIDGSMNLGEESQKSQVSSPLDFGQNSAVDHLVNAVMEKLPNRSETQVYDKVRDAVTSALKRKGAASTEESFRSGLYQELVKEVQGVDVASIADSVHISDVVRRELLYYELKAVASKNQQQESDIEGVLRQVVAEVFRNNEALATRETLNSALTSSLVQHHIATQASGKEMFATMEVDFVLQRGDMSLSSNTLSEEDLREELMTLVTEAFKGVIPMDKARRIGEGFVVALLGTTKGKEHHRDRALVDLVEEQVEKLVKETRSKQYRRIMIDSVLDMMSSGANISFDMFLFTELLNINGKRLLKLFQNALLNNIGLEDRSINKTIDLLI